MNGRLSLEREIAGWMADEAVGAPEAFLDEILQTTARTTPRPRWWALLVVRPMHRPSMRGSVGLPHRGLVYIAILALLTLLAVALAVGASLLLQPPQSPSADWPGFRGDANRSGVGLEGPAGKPVLDWRYQATGGVLEVAIAADSAYFASDDGQLHAVGADEGSERWSVPIPSGPSVGPYAADGRLYVADADGVVRAYAQVDGAPIWSSPVAYDAPSRMVSADGVVYFGTAGGEVVAIDGTTGAERWRIRPDGARSSGAPALGGGRLFVGTDGAGFVAIDLASHQVAWTGDTKGEQTGTATVADGIAYIGAGTDATTGSLRAFDAATGRLLWASADPILGIPAVADGVAYTTSLSGVVEALDTATGAQRWRVDVGSEIRSPVVAEGVVYVAAGARREVLAIDANTGMERWTFPIDGNANCCVAVTGGVVYVGTQAGSVYAIGGDGAAIVPKPFASAAPSPSPSEASVTDLAPAVTWSTPLDPTGIAPISQLAVAPDGQIWIPEAQTGRIAIVGADGKPLETFGSQGSGHGQFDFSRGNGDGYGTLAFAPDGSFYVLDVGNRRVQHFDAKRRFLGQWGSFGSGPGQYNDPVGIAVAPDGTVWVLDDRRDVLEHYAPDGTVLGSVDPFAAQPVNDGANSLAIDPAGNLYVSLVAPSAVAVFDPAGTFLRFVGEGVFTQQATDMAIDAAGRLFVTQGPDRNGSGILVFGPDGALLGGFGPQGTGDGEFAFAAGIALDGQGGLYVEDSNPDSARLVRFELPANLR